MIDPAQLSLPAGRRPAAGRGRRGFAAAARFSALPATLAVLATIALAVALVVLEGSRSLAINAWLLAIGGILIWTCWRALAGALPPAAASAFDSVRARPVEPPSRLPGVIAIEGAILDAEWSRSGAEFRLRPILRRIAAARLIEHHQVDLETEPAAARRILGDELWALVGPDPSGLPGPNRPGSRRPRPEPTEPEPPHLRSTQAGPAGASRPNVEATQAGPAGAGRSNVEATQAAPVRAEAGPVRAEAGSARAEGADTAELNVETTAQAPAEWTRTRRGRRGIPRSTIRHAIDLLEAL